MAKKNITPKPKATNKLLRIRKEPSRVQIPPTLQETKEIKKEVNVADFIEVKKIPSQAMLKMGSTKDVMFWAVQSMKAAAEKYTKRGFFEKYGTLISIIFLGLLMAFVSIYTLNKFVKISDTIASATIETAKLNQNVINYLQGLQEGIPKQPTTEIVERPIGR